MASEPISPDVTGSFAPDLSEGPGTRIGPYKLLQKIGEGGMGVVYMAEQEQPVRRRVALKVIKPGMDSRQVVARFEAERQALALMDHTHIAKVHDAGTTQTGRPYFVMELVHGVPITRYCDENRLTPRERLELFVPVCLAIQHAHQKGVIHRDIKPSNVLVTLYDGKPVPKVIDFGVAKATEQRLTERTLFTEFGAVVGTLEYMAPEQAEMSALGVDTRSDVYSLGVLLYELLTGSTPFERKRLRSAAFAEMLRIIKEEEPPRPSTRLSGSGEQLATISAQRKTEPAKLTKLVRGELDWIVMKCLEKDRTRRYDTANGLARDLQRYLADEAVEACPPSLGYKFKKLTRKHKTVLVTAAAFAVLLVAGTAVSVWQAVRATFAEDTALKAVDTALKAESDVRVERDDARRARDELRNTLYAADLNLIQAAWEANNVARVVELLDRQIPKAGERNLRGFEWHYWRRLCHADLRTVKLQGDLGLVEQFGSMNVAFSPDGSRFAAVHFSRERMETIGVWDTATGELRLQLKCPAPVPGFGFGPVTFSPDGTRLAAIIPIDGVKNVTEIRMWDSATGQELLTIPEGNSWLSDLAFSPDGTRLAALVNRAILEDGSLSYIKLWDSASGKELVSISAPNLSDFQGLAFSPDGKRAASTECRTLAPADTNCQLKVWNTADGKVVVTSPEISRQPSTVLFSPDGARIATGGSGWGPAASGVRIWDAANGKELVVLKDSNDPLVVFSRDSQRLACFGYDARIKVWDVAAGGLRLTLKGHTDMVFAAGFSHDGTRLYSAARDGTLKLWDVVPRQKAPDPKKEPDLSPWVVAVNAEGSRVAVAMNDFRSKTPQPSEIRVLDSAGKELRRFKVGTAGVDRLAFSPDGRHLAGVAFSEEEKRNRVIVWDVADGKERFSVKGLGKGPGHEREEHGFRGEVVYSPDGTRLAAAFNTQVLRTRTGASVLIICDAATGREIFSLAGGPNDFGAVAFSADGKRLASCNGSGFSIPVPDESGEVKIWDTATGLELLTWKVPGQKSSILTAALSPDGGRVAAATTNGIHVFDAAGAPLFTLKGHAGIVQSVGFSPDGRRIASAGSIGNREEIKLWDARSGQELLTLKHDSGTRVAFSPDGNRLFAFDGNPYGAQRTNANPLQIWDATPLAKERDNK